MKHVFNSKIAKNICVLIPILLVITAIGLGVYFFYYTIHEKMGFDSESAYSLHPNYVVNVYGYEQRDNLFFAEHHDPHIHYTVPRLKIASTFIKLAEPLSDEHHIQIFYSNENIGGFNEENSIQTILPAGEAEFSIDLPPGIYTDLRYDINIFDAQFEVLGILVSESPLVTVWYRIYQRESNILVLTLAANLIAVLISFFFIKKGYFEKIYAYCHTFIANTKKKNRERFNENKIVYIITLFISIILLLVFFGLLISLAFFNNSTIIIDMIGQIIMAFLLAVIIFCLNKSFSIFNRLLNLVKASFAAKLLIAFTCLFVMQMYIAVNISTSPGFHWDVGAIVYFAIDAAHSEIPLYSDYLSVFSNNTFLFFIIYHLILVFQFIGVTDYWLGLTVFNILCINISLLSSILIIKRAYPSSDTIIIFFIISSLLLGLSPWVIIPYSDTISAPLVSLLVLFCILTSQAKTTVSRIVFASLCGVLFAIGWLIKGTIIAVVAALLAVLLLSVVHSRNTVKFRHALSVIAAAVLCFALSLGLFELYTENQNIMERDRSIRAPMTYTIAMGLVELDSGRTRSSYGVWNWDVHNLRYGTTEEQNERFIQFIRERLQYLGVGGYASFLVNKARWITSEGFFFWHMEGRICLHEGDTARNFIRDLFCPSGRHFSFWRHAVNGLWIVVLSGCFFGILFPCFKGFRSSTKKKKFDADLFIRLCSFMIIIVILFTEGRSRYLISFLPIFCIVSARGYAYVIHSIKKALHGDSALLSQCM